MRPQVPSLCWQVVLILLSVPILAVLTCSCTVTASTTRGPIVITGDGDFTTANGVVGGDGTPSSPFVIEGWEIVVYEGAAVWIADTTAHFILRDLILQGGSDGLRRALVVDGSSNWALHDSTLTGAVNILNCDFVDILRNEVSEAAEGIKCYRSTNVVITDNYVTSCSESGISIVSYSDKVVVEGNNLQENGGKDLKLEICSNLTVSNNTFAHDGIILSTSMVYSDAWTITSDNTVNGLPVLFVQGEDDLEIDGVVAGQVIVAESACVTLRNMVVDDAGIGIQVVTCDGITIENTTATGCSLTGIRVSWSNDIAVIGCDLGFNAIGLADYANSNSSVSRCSFESNSASGIEIRHSSSSNVSQCSFFGGLRGVYFESVNGASIDECEFRNQAMAIYLYSCGCGYGRSKAVLIDSNRVLNGGYGVCSELTEDLIIRSNLFHNLELGIQAYFCTVFVYWNNFTDNEVHAQAFTSDFFDNVMNWNLSYPLGGNYWDNYTGIDEFSGPDQDQPGPDGIGDTPYVINADSMDYYPLMGPYSVSPVADAGLDQTVTVGEEVTFDGSDSSDDIGIENYTWTFTYDDEEKELYGVNPTFTFDIVGAYNVTLTVMDDDSQTDSDWMFVTVQDVVPTNDPPIANAGNDQTVMVGDEVSFDGSGSSDDSGVIENYTWSFTYDGEAKELYDVNPKFTFDIAGTYVVTLTVEDAEGETSTDSVTITVEEEEQEDQDRNSLTESYGIPLGIVLAFAVIAMLLFFGLRGRKGGKAPTGTEEAPATETQKRR